MLAECYYPLAQ